jgi:hypothetical protein
MHFGPDELSMDSLFLDERWSALGTMLKAANADVEESNRQAYKRTAPLVRSLMKLGMTPPASFHSVAESALRSHLLQILESEEIHSDEVMNLLEEARFWQVELSKKELEDTLRRKIEKVAQESRNHAGDLNSLGKFAAAVDLASRLSFNINYYHTQNIYYELFKNDYPQLRLDAENGDKHAALWIEGFRDLGKKLSVRID